SAKAEEAVGRGLGGPPHPLIFQTDFSFRRLKRASQKAGLPAGRRPHCETLVPVALQDEGRPIIRFGVPPIKRSMSCAVATVGDLPQTRYHSTKGPSRRVPGAER